MRTSIHFKGLKMNYKIITKFVLILSFSISSTIAGTLKGNVKYDGKPPKKKRLRMDADPVCGSSHSKPVLSENFKMSDFLMGKPRVSRKRRLKKRKASSRNR